MLQRHNNTLSCPDCGRTWHFMDAEGLQAGDSCPSDDCPSNENNPLGIISKVCREFDGNGIFSIGANAALKAMARHWKVHLAEGHSPKIISDDIDEMSKQLETMRAEIMRRIFGADTKPATVCQKCGSHMEGDYCSDETCPYSEWPQRVTLDELQEKSADELRNRYSLLPRVRVFAEAHDDSHFKKVEFDAAPWFAQATDEQIIDLHGIGWTGDEPSDVVADFFEKSNQDIAGLFEFCRATQKTRNAVGFECSVDEDSAMEWLKQHRPGLWARLVCDNEGIMLTQKGSNFGWDDAKEETSADGFASKEEAALNAVKVLELAS